MISLTYFPTRCKRVKSESRVLEHYGGDITQLACTRVEALLGQRLSRVAPVPGLRLRLRRGSSDFPAGTGWDQLRRLVLCPDCAGAKVVSKKIG